MKPFHIDIVTPDGLAYSGQVESLLVKTDDGDTEILCGHADYMASVGTGRARLIIDGKARYASVNGGFLSVNGGDVNLVTITFEFADQIDVKRAEKAREKAEEALKSAKSDKELDLAKAKLLSAMSRINVAGYK
jgi:F-type H+-transporting ATPase subunit epsilon